MTTVFHAWPYGRIIEVQAVLAIEIMYEPQSNLEDKVNPGISKDDVSSRPIHFHINSTSVIGPIKKKKNQLSFSSIEINKPFLAPVYSVS